MAIRLSARGLDFPELDDPLNPEFPDAAPLWRFPNIPSNVVSANASVIGRAGEALVDSVFLRYGLMPLDVPDCFPCDRLVAHPDRLIPVQVKTTCSPGKWGYTVHATRGYRGSPQGRRAYTVGDYDIFAIAILDRGAVVFSAQWRSRYTVRHETVEAALANPRATLDRCFDELDMRLPDEAATEAARFARFEERCRRASR